MHLNEVAEGLEPLDLSQSPEFASLLQSARDLGIPHEAGVRYRSWNTVVRHHRLHFLEWGAEGAPAVLLLHGGNQSAHSWDLVSLHLADRYHVYALDQRGHGDSEWVRDRDYSSEAMAADALAFIEQRGLREPIVVGHSMGGMVTMRLALQASGLARAYVFVDVGPNPNMEGAQTIRDFIVSNVEYDRLEDFVERVRGYDPFRSLEHIERTARYNLIRRVDGKYVSKSDRVLHDAERNLDLSGRPTLDDVRRIEAPTLVVRGEHSNVLTPEGARDFADALPRGQLVEVPRCGHNVHSQNTPGFLEALTPFLASLAPAPV